MSAPLPRLPALLAAVVGLTCRSPAPALAQDAGRPVAMELTPASPGDHFEMFVLPGGDTLRFTIYVPRGLDGGTPVPLVVGLHYGGMAHPWIGGAYLHQLVKPALEDMGAILVAPDALAAPNASYRTESWTSPRNESAVISLTRGLLATYPIDPKKVVVTGYSSGGAGVWFLAERYPDLFSAAIPVSARPSYERVSNVKIPVHVIHSWNDEVIGAMLVHGAVDQLRAVGADVEMRMISGVTHYQTGAFVEPLRDALPWLRKVWGRAR